VITYKHLIRFLSIYCLYFKNSLPSFKILRIFPDVLQSSPSSSPTGTIQRPLFGVDTMVVNEVGPTLIESTSVVQSKVPQHELHERSQRSLCFYSLRKDTEFYGEFSPPDLLVSLRTSLAELHKIFTTSKQEQRSVHSPCSEQEKCLVLLHSIHSIPFLYNPSWQSLPNA
jgi:hypothetical protein